MLRYYEHDGEVGKAISVVKKRNGRHERTIRSYQLASSGITVGDTLNGFRGILCGTPHVLHSSPERGGDPAHA